MAGLDAGQSFNTWPKMGETFFPEGLFFVDEKYMGIFENSIFIHFFHRSLAYLCVAIILSVMSLGGSQYNAFLGESNSARGCPAYLEPALRCTLTK